MPSNDLEPTAWTVGVTGGTGFIGRHLLRGFARHSASLRLLARRPDAAPPGLAEVVLGDVADPSSLAELVRECDLVYHLAGVASVPASLADPAASLETNTMGTLRLLEACRRADVPRVVLVSTWAVSATGSAYSPYAASKAAAELVARCYRESYGFTVAVVRLANVYGPGQDRRAFVPSMVRALATGTAVRLSGPGIVRDFLFAADCAEALIRLGARIEAVPPITAVGSGWLVSAEHLTEVAGQVLGTTATVQYEPDGRPGPSPEPSVIEPLLRIIGDWRRTSLADGIHAVHADLVAQHETLAW
jgi:nucleoside-diphosphate-sugar epimerase